MGHSHGESIAVPDALKPIDPWELAYAMGIPVSAVESLLFEVATDGNSVLYATHRDPAVVIARVFAGLARCLLLDLGDPYTEAEAVELAGILSIRPCELH